ncbi:MAG: hypothetical protein ACM3JG_07115 [Thiohalocapsa sp.]
MASNGHVRIVVDDDVSLRILSGVAGRCGGRVRVAQITWLELTVPERPGAPGRSRASSARQMMVWAEPAE